MSSTLQLEVSRREQVAEGVVELTLQHPEGARLPDWTPGAHIAVHLPNGLVRPYSLCGDRWDAHTFTIAVRREEAGGGGSVYIHDELRLSTRVGVGMPRNAFPLVPSRAALFIAGGIGISPILPMLHAADTLGMDTRLIYVGRSLETMPYADRLAAAYHPAQVDLLCSAAGRPDLAGLVTGWVESAGQSARVYACGPGSMLSDLEMLSSAWPAHMLRTEVFTRPVLAGDSSFVVDLEQSRKRICVPRDKSLLDMLHATGVDVPSSCRVGSCGACETPVLSGDVDHRDGILTDADSGVMYPCVSRARGTLVLDA